MKRPTWIFLACTVLHLTLGGFAAYRETPTVDEFAHLPAGLAYGSHGSWDLYSKNPPLIKLWASLPVQAGLAGPVTVPKPEVGAFGWGPWLYGLQFERMNADRYLRIFFAARLMILLLSLAAAALLFVWLKEEAGDGTALLASGGFLLSPTVLAHAHLATVDIGSAFTMLLFVFCASRARGVRGAVFTGAAFGAALAAKFTAVFLSPLFFLAMWRLRPRWSAAASVMTALVVLNLCYGFSSSWNYLDEFTFVSRAMKSVQANLPGALPLPFAKDFISGFDAQVGDTEQGEFSNYLFGEWSRDGWWYYNFVALAVKENPVTLLLWLAAPFVWIGVRSRAWGWSAAASLLILFPMTFANPLQVGIRYLLPAFPFLFVVLAFAVREIERRVPRMRTFLPAAVVTVWALSAILHAPAYISYFNSLARLWGAPENVLIDSNLDWGQDLYRVAELGKPVHLLYFGHADPALYGIRFDLVPREFTPGLHVVSVNFWKGMSYVAPSPDGAFANVAGDHVAWLRAYEPVARLGSMLVFEISAKP